MFERISIALAETTAKGVKPDNLILGKIESDELELLAEDIVFSQNPKREKVVQVYGLRVIRTDENSHFSVSING